TASADDIAAAKSDLSLDIARAYWDLVTAIESLRVVTESDARIDAHLKDVRNQLTAGLIPPNDVSSVEAQASRQRMLTVQASSARDVAEAELARLVGAPPGTPIQPADALDVPPAVTTPLATLVDEAKRQRPERAALEKRVAASEARTHAAA